MNCTCIEDIEKKALACLIENGKLKKPVLRVSMRGVVFGVTEKTVVTRTVNVLEIELEGQKKLETMSMFHSFCPFCGINQEPEA